MSFINLECKITKQEAHELLLKHKNHYLWNIPYQKWTLQDLEKLKKGNNSNVNYERHIRNQRVEVAFNNGIKKKYASIKSVANKFKINQSTVSNILSGRKRTDKFLSITKI